MRGMGVGIWMLGALALSGAGAMDAAPAGLDAGTVAGAPAPGGEGDGLALAGLPDTLPGAARAREVRVQEARARLVRTQEARAQEARTQEARAQLARAQDVRARETLAGVRRAMGPEVARARQDAGAVRMRLQAQLDTLRLGGLDRVRIVGLNRPRLGIAIEPEANRPGVVRVVEVTRGMGAEEAGLQVGDRIVAVNGVPLPAGPDEDPGAALVERVSALAAGDTVSLRVERGGEVQAFEVELRHPLPTLSARGVTWPGEPPRVLEVMGMGRTHGIEATDLNPGLATYFGRESGALILTLDAGAPEGLREGDVIMAIDGREVPSVRDLRRILGSYRSGETLTFRVWREGAGAEVRWTVP